MKIFAQSSHFKNVEILLSTANNFEMNLGQKVCLGLGSLF